MPQIFHGALKRRIDLAAVPHEACRLPGKSHARRGRRRHPSPVTRAAIYGPGAFAERASSTGLSFQTEVLLAGMRGRLKRYLAFSVVTWVAALRTSARGSIARHSTAVCPVNATASSCRLGGHIISTARRDCNRGNVELAGIDHRVEDLDYRTDPESLTLESGPTPMAIAQAAAREVRAPRSADNPTSRRLAYHPMSLDDGLGLLIPWLRQLGRL